MAQKFIIALDTATADARDAITNHLLAQGWKVWHWLEDLWLVSEVSDDVTPRLLWDELKAMPSVRKFSGLVMNASPEMLYWGGNKPESWVWMKENWGKADHKPKIEPAPSESQGPSGD